MRLRRYRHNRSNTHLQSYNMGLLVPSMARHCIQGTTLVGGVSAGIQLAPMVHQALSVIRVDSFAIAVADRLIWEDAEKFYTGGDTGDERPETPYILSPADGGWPVGSLADHLGFPTGVPNLKCNALPFRLYAWWWNERIRDPQLQDEIPFGRGSGLDTVTNTALLRMNWPKDMFTTARPEITIGNDVVIPIATNAPVTADLASNGNAIVYKPKDNFTAASYNMGTNLYPMLADGQTTSTIGSKSTQLYNQVASPAQVANYKELSFGPNGNVATAAGSGLKIVNGTADLSGATGVLPEDFNFAMARAKWKSRRNLFGTAYKDWLSFLGVRYSDRRLGLPSTLKHGSSTVDISGVLQTAPGSDSVVGQMAGRGTSYASCRYKTYFEEPTTVIHMTCVRPAPVYVNMMPPEWNFEVREDIFTPEFAHVGMVEETVGTLFPTGTDNDKKRFGFRNRYDEMRTAFNTVSGNFKTVNADYHQGRIFATAPALNGDFLACNPSPRIFANLNGDQIESAAVRNVFIEKNIVTPNGDPRF